MDMYPPTEPDWDDLYSLDDEMERALALDCEKLRALTGEDHGPFEIIALPPGYTFTPQRDWVLSEVRRLLDNDAHAATMVAALVSTVQSSTESRPAFVKRIVRAWLDEMGRVG
jgi:hypothetical protein